MDQIKLESKTENMVKGSVNGLPVKIWIVRDFEDWAGKPHGSKPELTGFHYCFQMGSFSGRLDGDDPRYLQYALNRLESDFSGLVDEALVKTRENHPKFAK